MRKLTLSRRPMAAPGSRRKAIRLKGQLIVNRMKLSRARSALSHLRSSVLNLVDAQREATFITNDVLQRSVHVEYWGRP